MQFARLALVPRASAQPAHPITTCSNRQALQQQRLVLQPVRQVTIHCLANARCRLTLQSVRLVVHLQNKTTKPVRRNVMWQPVLTITGNATKAQQTVRTVSTKWGHLVAPVQPPALTVKVPVLFDVLCRWQRKAIFAIRQLLLQRLP